MQLEQTRRRHPERPYWRLFAVAIAGLAACATSSPDSAPPLSIKADLDAFIEDAWAGIGGAPGLAVAVYTPEGVYARGFGVTDIETGEPVTTDTAFYIASSTKSFTALSMNILHHHGEIDLDATLAEFAPDAPFSTSVRPEEVRARNLLTHTSGIANWGIGIRAAYTGEHTPTLMWDLLSTSEVNGAAPLGVFQYTNVGYNVLTTITDRQLDLPWQDLIAREIIAPTGMSRTTAYMSRAEAEGWSLAEPHGPDALGHLARLHYEKTDATMQSAGGMVMSAEDALIWLELLVNDGRLHGEQIISADAVRETRGRFAEVNLEYGDYQREDYGLGWYVGRYRDDVLVHSFGSFPGFQSHISYIPGRRVGVAVFANDTIVGATFPDGVANFVYDRFAGLHEGESGVQAASAALIERYRNMTEGFLADREQRGRRAWTLSQPRSAYVGTYEGEELGVLRISLEGEDLYAELGDLRSIAEPYTAPDSIRVELAPMTGWVIGFDVGDDGIVTAAELFGVRLERR